MKMINLNDVAKGFLVAVITALISGLYASVQAGGLEFTWIFFAPIVKASIGMGIVYLLKNVFGPEAIGAKSRFMRLDLLDALKGFAMACFAAAITALYNAIQMGGIEFTWLIFKPVLAMAIGGGLAYLLKNVFTNSEGQVMLPEQPENRPFK